MVAHQAIVIDIASGKHCLTPFVNVGLCLPPKGVKKTQVALIFLKHLLFVHSSIIAWLTLVADVVRIGRGIISDY